MEVDAVRLYVYIVWKQGFTLAARVTRNKSSRIIRIRELRFSTNLSRKVTKLFPRLYKLLKNVLPSPSRYSGLYFFQKHLTTATPLVNNLRHPLRNRSNFLFRRFHPPPPSKITTSLDRDWRKRLEDKVSKMEMGGRVILITVGKGGRRGTKWHGRF